MPKRKHKDREELINQKIVNIKCGLRSKCLNEKVFEKIQQDVEEMSSLFVEVSRYIHFSLNKEWSAGSFNSIKFLDYYYHLLDGSKSKYELDTEYREMRSKNNLRLYDKSYKSNLFVAEANKYETLFHNNIWMHAYTRIRKFFKQFNKKSYDTLDFLFREKGEKAPDPELLKVLEEKLDWDGTKFYEITNKLKYQKYIKFFYKLQRFNEEKGLKNFSLIPQLKYGRHHVRYDSFALFQLLCSQKLFKGAWKTFEREVEWKKYFLVPETRTKKFNYSIMTDGVSTSISMVKNEPIIMLKSKKRKLQNEEELVQGNLLKIRENIDKYDVMIGLDPGQRLIFGGIRNDRPLKIKSSKFRHMTGFHQRLRKLKKWTPSKDFKEYIMYQLSIFKSRLQENIQRKVARLKLKKFICVESASHQLAKEIIGPVRQRALVVIGSTKVASNSPIKGYVRTPQPKILEALKKYADVLEVGEFRTTKLCAGCHQEHFTSKSPHRYQFCKKCNITWNRDVNAGKNILYLGLCIIEQRKKNTNFCKISK